MSSADPEPKMFSGSSETFDPFAAFGDDPNLQNGVPHPDLVAPEVTHDAAADAPFVSAAPEDAPFVSAAPEHSALTPTAPNEAAFTCAAFSSAAPENAAASADSVSDSIPDITAYFSNAESPSTFDFIGAGTTITSAAEEDLACLVDPFSRLSASSVADRLPVDEASPDVITSKDDLHPATDVDVNDAIMRDDDDDNAGDGQSHAWIPPPRTRLCLARVKSGGQHLPDDDAPTTPRILMTENLGDPVSDMAERLFGPEGAAERKTLTVNDVTRDASGLRRLIATENFRSAVDLSRLLLEQASHRDVDGGSSTRLSPTTLRLWTTRLTLMMTKLHLYPAVEAELSAFGDLDRPDLYFDFYPAGVFPSSASGSMVPFALRVLRAELPAHLGKPEETLDRLFSLQAVVDAMIANLERGLTAEGEVAEKEKEDSDEETAAALETWRPRRLNLLYAISNALLLTKDVDSSVAICDRIVLEESEGSRKSAVLSSAGRILLQIGDIGGAADYFARAEAVLDDDSTAAARAMKLTHRGYLSIGAGRFDDALRHFRQASALTPDDAVATNNVACALVYLGSLKEAVATLRSLVEADPRRNLHEGVVFNLATLFELESSGAGERKRDLLGLVARHKGDGFSPQCLKIG